MWKQILTNYFTFTKKERHGTIVLLVFILLFTLLPFLYPLFISSKPADAAAFKKEIAALKIKQQDTVNRSVQKNNFDEDNYQNYYQPSEKNYNNKTAKGELFYFDPNTATVTDWQRLGIRDKTIATIQNYLSKGGHFYRPEDIGKIWGLHPDEIERLIPYIQIAAKENNYPQKNYEAKIYDKPKYTPSVIDVNTADTTAFIALPGICSKLNR
jgi:DNA uptake protein ComE-like DNA-binding protein